ncbi:MAG: TRAP transporter small permease subunit [Candidatus Pelagibacter sp.]|jgi:TRAP-type C4-dicarboxylate transport system permease small subunit
MDTIIKYSGYLASWLFVSIGFIVFYEVVMRYIFNSPTIWVEEISRFLQIWATYLALTYSFHKRDFIRITFIYDKLSLRGQRFLDIISFVFIIFFSSVVVYYGWIIAKDSFDVGRTSSSMLDLPAFISEFAIPICFGFLLLKVVIELVKNILILFKS